ncbi:MAG: hypothetical protein ACE1ZM_02660, partial [Gammaproteobacteria bacterium]
KIWGEKIKVAFIGTAPIDLFTKQKFEEVFDIQLLENFALSETTFFTTETKDNIKKRRAGSLGEILPYADLKFIPLENEKNEEGRIFLGGRGGIISFVPGTINTIEPDIVVYDFQIDDVSIFDDSINISLDAGIYDVEKIELSYNQNNIAFEFSSIHFSRLKFFK